MVKQVVMSLLAQHERVKIKKIIHNLKMKLGLPFGNPLYTFPIVPVHVFDVTIQDIDEEFIEWMYTNVFGDWKYIYTLGNGIWGIGFYDEIDAMAFKLKWDTE